MGIIKIVWVCSWAALATAVLFLPMTIAAFLGSTGNAAFNVSKVWAHVMLIVTGVRTEIRGREKIEAGRSYIIISNHQSLFDIPALVTRLGIQFRWVIKKELLKVPLFGYALWASKNIFIDRSDRGQAVESIREGLKRLPPGVSVMVFAEGTRSPDGAIRPFKKGGFVIAIDNGLPILPVTVNGSRRVLPKGSMAYSSGSIEVVVGDPIDTGDQGREGLEIVMQRTRDAIIANFNPGYPSGEGGVESGSRGCGSQP
ncbi:MAG: 1-acyl-sn-glycerol-3-phosphate acyltransferase [Deltaproteobacteria bacterium]|nr:1-acyl-sn-glycerol-3-phosphate acyltransferase [Deltaproteobacteria bacterium]